MRLNNWLINVFPNFSSDQKEILDNQKRLLENRLHELREINKKDRLTQRKTFRLTGNEHWTDRKNN